MLTTLLMQTIMIIRKPKRLCSQKKAHNAAIMVDIKTDKNKTHEKKA